MKQDAIQWQTTEKLSQELIRGRWGVQGVDGVSHEAIEQMQARVPKAFIKTLTLDIDKAFANHPSIGSKLEADVCFTRPYISQDKGRGKIVLEYSGDFFRREQTFVKLPRPKVLLPATWPCSNWNIW